MPKRYKDREPLYELPHNIRVMHEIYGTNTYVRVRILANDLFDSKIEKGGFMTVRRNKVMLTAALGRKIGRKEHIHHKNGDPKDDRVENLEIITPAEHNRHHKTGSRHTDESKAKTSAALKRAYANGERTPTDIDVCIKNIQSYNNSFAASFRPRPWMKPERNARLLFVNHILGNLKDTAEIFNIQPASVREIVQKYGPYGK